MKYNHNMDEKNYTSSYTCSCGPIRRYMESRSCDVQKYVGLLVLIENIWKLCMQMNLTKEPFIHNSPVICTFDIQKSRDWVCNFMNGILSQMVFYP